VPIESTASAAHQISRLTDSPRARLLHKYRMETSSLRPLSSLPGGAYLPVPHSWHKPCAINGQRLLPL
jgi:hypothetical protein